MMSASRKWGVVQKNIGDCRYRKITIEQERNKAREIANSPRKGTGWKKLGNSGEDTQGYNSREKLRQPLYVSRGGVNKRERSTYRASRNEGFTRSPTWPDNR